MKILEAGRLLTRRRALAIGSGAMGGLIMSRSFAGGLAIAQDAASQPQDTTPPKDVQTQIEDILDAQGSASDGVFSVEIDRDDIDDVTIHGVPIKPSFEVNGTLCFQNGGNGSVIYNGDLAVKASETQHFIDKLIFHGIMFQAFHMHFYDFSPMVWFIHSRAVGDPVTIAKGLKAALDTTSTPFPQTMPSNPKTPLPANEMGKILGATPTIGADGVVTFEVPRKEPLVLGGRRINPYLNVMTDIAFEPWGGGQNAAGVVDFSMIASEIQNVLAFTRKKGWDVGCLYNQETAESPQLFFSHNLKTGNAIELAREMRQALDMTNSMFS